MSVTVTALRTVRDFPSTAARERATLRRVGIAWGLLVLNALTYYGSVLHIPSSAGKAITQGALPAALIVALTVNRRVILRPNAFLCMVSLLVIAAIIAALQPEHVGTLYRTFRAAEFVAVLWLLTPWWGRRDLLLIRCYLIALWVALGSVVLGLLVVPGRALSGGRLSGVIWGIPATEVAHYAAIATGAVVVLWFGGLVSGRATMAAAAVGGVLLLLSHTRTALIAMAAALLVAGLSLVGARVRVRKFFVVLGVVIAIGAMTAAGVATVWLARGQNAAQLTSLTGRTDFWSLVLNLPRSRFQEIFGFGLSNGSIDGLPIDSNWLVAYLQQGLFGVIVCAAMPLFLLVNCFFQPSGTKRALAFFFITYCLIASITQVGFADDTTYLLELTLAASLLVPSAAGRRRE